MLIVHFEGGRHEQPMPFDVETIHYNAELGSHIVTTFDKAMLLVLRPKANLFELEELAECKRHINLCSSSERLLVLAGGDLLQFYNFESKAFCGEFSIEAMLGDYYQPKGEVPKPRNSKDRFSQLTTGGRMAISCIECSDIILLVGFNVVSLVLQFSIEAQPAIIRTIKLQSCSFLRLDRILLDSHESTALLICSHNETIEHTSLSDLQLGEPIIVGSCNRKTVNTITQLSMNVTNNQYALRPLRWEPIECINMLGCSWRDDNLLHLHNKIVGNNWEHPLEQSLSSDLHPTGTMLAIGFRDCFKIYAVANSGLYGLNMTDAVRECKSLCYSPQGHHLAVMSSCNVHIYNSYTCERLHVLQHPQSTSIRRLKYVGN